MRREHSSFLFFFLVATVCIDCVEIKSVPWYSAHNAFKAVRALAFAEVGSRRVCARKSSEIRDKERAIAVVCYRQRKFVLTLSVRRRVCLK